MFFGVLAYLAYLKYLIAEIKLIIGGSKGGVRVGLVSVCTVLCGVLGRQGGQGVYFFKLWLGKLLAYLPKNR